MNPKKSSGPSRNPLADPELLLETEKFRVVRKAYLDAQGQTRTKDMIHHPGAVVVLPVLDDGRICLIRNRRVTVNETLLEAPAGTLDPGELPVTCAARELQEETGYAAAALHPLGWFYLSPGILDERMHLFVAAGLTAGAPNLMPDEQIENLLLPYEEALRLVENGQIRDAKTMVALFRFAGWRRDTGA